MASRRKAKPPEEVKAESLKLYQVYKRLSALVF